MTAVLEASPAVARKLDDERFRHVPSLDGLRAISILMVLGFHGMGPVSRALGRTFAGWAGVDIFFVISGFLITSLLLQEQKDSGEFSFKNFYVRRTLRIWPAYYIYLAIVLATGFADSASVGISAVYLTNYDIALGWGFTAKGQGHLWSLAVEEQFYLLWPAILHLAGRRKLLVAIGTIGAVSIWRMALIVERAIPERIGAAFDTRLDCILYGCLAAILWASPLFRSRIRAWMTAPATPLITVVALVCAVQSLGREPAPGREAQLVLWVLRMPTFNVLTALLILSLLAQRTSGVARFLEHPILTWIGRLSYSLYLWHGFAFLKIWPLLAGVLPFHLGDSALCMESCRFAAALLLASASYHLVEMPFLKLKKRWSSERRTSRGG